METVSSTRDVSVRERHAETMKRIPEPELMDRWEQAQAYAAADFDEPHAMFIERFRTAFPGVEITGRVLDLGCGPADITIRFARSFAGCSLDAMDADPNMLALGQAAITGAGLNERVQLVQGRLPDWKPTRCGFDTIISNSLLHHLSDPMALWQAVREFSRYGTRAFIMDLKRPASPEAARALVHRYAAGEPEVLQTDFYHSLCAGYRVGEVRDQLSQAGLGQLVIQEPSDRHWIVAGVVS